MTKNDGNNKTTLIDTESVVDGKITGEGDIRVDGFVKGDISINGNVSVGKEGKINGKINAEVINIDGTITGSLIAKYKIVLESAAILKGDIITKILVVEMGATFIGESNME